MDISSILNEINVLENSIIALENANVNVFDTYVSRILTNGTNSSTTVAWAPNSGDTAWMLFSSALVLFMTMPGLVLYYAGMLQSKNMLSVAMQIFSICGLITFLWLSFGYSLSFSPSGFHLADETEQTYQNTLVYGNGQRLWLQGMQLYSYHFLATTIPESVYCMFQLTFAIITACLIVGSITDRVKYHSLLVFIALWHFCVYCPIAHSFWHQNGFLYKYGVLDYAGGNVVHISSGMTSLVGALIVGNRSGWKPNLDTHPPHNILLTFIGMSMLWVGWFGFNAGSAVGAGPRAGYAMLATMIATSVASLSWMITEMVFRKRPSVLGMINGAVAGLVCITPGCGWVDMNGAVHFGLASLVVHFAIFPVETLVVSLFNLKFYILN